MFNHYQVPTYGDLEWRLDALLGTRSLQNIAEPIVTLQLKLDNANSEGIFFFTLVQLWQ